MRRTNKGYVDAKKSVSMLLYRYLFLRGRFGIMEPIIVHLHYCYDSRSAKYGAWFPSSRGLGHRVASLITRSS
jgi:hypothetical protein